LNDGTEATDRYMTPTPHLAGLTRLELAMLRAQEGFERWAVEVNGRATGVQLSFAELALLNCLRMRGRTPSLAEMLLFLNRQDVPNIQYCLRKLEAQGLVERGRKEPGRPAGYRLSARGVELTARFAERRNAVIGRWCEDIRDFDRALNQAAEALERLVGIYDQATQQVLNHHILDAEP
jgi:predicted MarR family transcription regulator